MNHLLPGAPASLPAGVDLDAAFVPARMPAPPGLHALCCSGWRWLLSRIPVALCAALILTGCQPSAPKPPRPVTLGNNDINELHLLTSAAAVSLDGQGLAAGFAIRVYASSPASAETVPIARGTLDILMYDGVVPPAAIATNTPLQTWSFTADQLRASARVSAVGTSYPLTLRWLDKKPTLDRITVLACYRDPRNVNIYSALATVFVQAH
jgi:hypothetical protein